MYLRLGCVDIEWSKGINHIAVWGPKDLSHAGCRPLRLIIAHEPEIPLLKPFIWAAIRYHTQCKTRRDIT